ncbi:MAG: hypothetical protein JO015_18595 [Verrucomicrobia bacterium]|nr:hypothetical protein [Verrucomicrobiota bacterium]
MSKPRLSPRSWIFHQFPDLDPTALVRLSERSGESFSPEEQERALWIWNRRPSETRVLLHLLILSVGALAHVPLIILADIEVIIIFHSFYLILVFVLAGTFVVQEARYRRWRRDYLRSLARVVEQQTSQPDI